MPALRLSRQPLASVLLASVLISVALPPAARACPVVEPQTMRMLYQGSELVVVARLGESVVVEADDSGRELKTRLLVSETLKGHADEKGVFLFHRDWQGGGELPAGIAPGDNLLLFLMPRAGSGGYQLPDMGYGSKKLTAAELGVYRQRLAELAVILRQSPPDAADLVEWFVRCAEEPATRWEGAYELLNNVRPPLAAALDAPSPGPNMRRAPVRIEFVDADTQAADTQTGDTQAADANAQTADAAAVPAVTPGAAQEGATVATEGPGTRGDAEVVVVTSRTGAGENLQVVENIMALVRPQLVRGKLTAEQKNRLLDALYNTPEFSYKDDTLLQLVQDWDDARLVPFLVAQLRRMKDDPGYSAEQLVALLAAKVGDKELVKLAEEYSAKAVYADETEEAADASSDQYEVSDEGQPGSDEEQQADATTEAADDNAPEQSAPTADAPADNAAASATPAADDEGANDKRSAREKRSARLEAFLAAVELKLMQQMAQKW